MKNYYESLQISQNATDAEIKKAYRKLAKKYHPDANPGDKTAEARFKELSEAYTVLSDADKKADYDRRMFGTGASDNAFGNGKPEQSNTGAYRPNRNMSAKDFGAASSAFESFFGFDPKSSSPTLNKGDKNVRPMKTSEAFETIFGKKKF